MNFITELDEAAAKDIAELNRFIESAIKDDPFIGEACLPLLNGGKRLRPLLFFICAKTNTITSSFSCGVQEGSCLLLPFPIEIEDKLHAFLCE